VCLDVLCGVERERDAAHAVVGALAAETIGLPGAADAVRSIEAAWSKPGAEANARSAVERLAVLAAAAALRASAPAPIAEAFARTRRGRSRGATYGCADLSPAETSAILQRALPV
jgi:putative acyl-CoA dehydrogenase